MTSLRTRIALFYAALIVVVIALGAVAIDFALRSVLIDQTRLNLAQTAEDFKNNAVEATTFGFSGEGPLTLVLSNRATLDHWAAGHQYIQIDNLGGQVLGKSSNLGGFTMPTWSPNGKARAYHLARRHRRRARHDLAGLVLHREVGDRPDRAADRGDRRDRFRAARPPAALDAPRRAGPARERIRRDARPAAVGVRARAPVHQRRLARTAHAAHDHQRERADAAALGRPRSGALARLAGGDRGRERPARRDGFRDAHAREGRGRRRDPERTAGPRAAGRRRRRARAGARGGERARPRGAPPAGCQHDRDRRCGAAAAAGRQPDRQRREVHRVGADRRGRAAR